jgi:hypothetical protein
MDRNKIITILVLLCGTAFGQVSSNTPSRPRRFTEFTVAGLPAASGTTGQTFIVTDAASAGSCSSGGGSNRSWCRSNGTSYDAVGDGGTGGGGSGTVTTFSSGNLSPIFTTSVATATTTPALSFTISNAAAHTFLGNNTGSSAAAAYLRPACSDLSDSSGGCTMSTTGAGDISGTLPSVTVTNGSHITNSSIPNSGLVNTGTTVSGATCTLGSTCIITRECSDGIGDGLNAIPAGTYLATNCFNDFGATYTITGIRCFTDNSGSSTLNAANDGATGLLTGAVTCSSSFAAGTQSGTTTIATSHWINFTFVADGTSKRATFEVTVTR